MDSTISGVKGGRSTHDAPPMEAPGGR